MSPASAPNESGKVYPNRVLEDQDVEMQPVVMGTPPFSSPDPATDGIRMLPLEDQTTPNAAEAADQAAELRELGSYGDKSPDELKSLAEERDLTVTRTDGKDGRLRKEDYVAALTQDDTSDMKAADFKELVAGASTEEELQSVADTFEASGREYASVNAAIDKRLEEIQAEAAAAEESGTNDGQ